MLYSRCRQTCSTAFRGRRGAARGGVAAVGAAGAAADREERQGLAGAATRPAERPAEGPPQGDDGERLAFLTRWQVHRCVQDADLLPSQAVIALCPSGRSSAWLRVAPLPKSALQQHAAAAWALRPARTRAGIRTAARSGLVGPGRGARGRARRRAPRTSGLDWRGKEGEGKDDPAQISFKLEPEIPLSVSSNFPHRGPARSSFGNSACDIVTQPQRAGDAR